MRRFLILVASVLLLATTGLARRAAAVTGGTPIPDPAADAVVLVYDDSLAAQCSGALIAPNVVLTAAHCLTNPTGNFYVLGGLNPFSSALFTILASEVHLHPSYEPNGPTHDVGVLILSSAAPVDPLPWAATDEGYYAFGTLVSMLGYGATTPLGSDSGIRRIGGATISTSIGGGVFATDDTSGQGMCVGDSGGPALTTDELAPSTIIGVASYGDQDCAQLSVFERTDANSAFIALFAPEPSVPASAGLASIVLVLISRRRA